jgi:hypothetical protein
MKMLVASCLLLLCGGCGLIGPRIIIVPPGEPVRLLEAVTAKVESVDQEGKTVVGKATIPAGWYCLPDQGE